MAFVDSFFRSNKEDNSQDLLLAALDQLAEGVIVADADGRLIYVNSAAAKIHGVSKLHVSPDEYSETYNLLTVDGDPYPSKYLPLSRSVLFGETVRNARWKIEHPSGRIVDAEGTARPVRDSQGKQIASVLTIEDCTDKREADEALAQALEDKDALLDDVNHRVKNNLTLVGALLHLQSSTFEDKTTRTAFRNVSSRVNILSDIHRRLHTVGQQHRIDVVGFLGTMTVDTVRASAMTPRVEVELSRSGEAMFPSDKATTLALALYELTLNSLNHAFEEVAEPVIELDISASDDMLTIVYADNGCGLRDADAWKNGGMGRALIDSLAANLSANIQVQTDRPGFHVTITLPIPSPRPTA